MGRNIEDIPEDYRGPWCDEESARSACQDSKERPESDGGAALLRRQWARVLMKGDLKAAHKLWGKWQGYSGRDPWDEPGWRNYWVRQKSGEKLWAVDGVEPEEQIVLECFISYWEGK